MINVIPFRTRARTIDHLGREQIADCPTAVSELWKNAYDAYARSVELHIFDGKVPIAAVVDDGHGMSLEEFKDRWLMVGTEAKVDGSDIPQTDRDGLSRREKHGQKGIGRLSVAALGPVTLVISKRRRQPFVAALLDWRLFENPFLHLEDILVPVQEFADTSAFQGVLEGMQDALVDNVWGRNGKQLRNERVERAWRRYDETSLPLDSPRPSVLIVESALAASVTARHLDQWAAWRGDADKGTALFILGANYELSVWNKLLADDRDEPTKIRALLRTTLTGFVDPFQRPASESAEFRYRVVNHVGNHESPVLSSDEHFSLEDLHSLEHFVEGAFDETGMFRGRVRAFGKDIPTVELAPVDPPPLRGPGYVGPFDICLGTFEQELPNSTHPAQQHHILNERAERFSGLAIYRDGLRVMPYGRPEADYFGMEERRSLHAGRWFWVHRRSFGRVAIRRAANPSLRDKAGREGLVDNRARRELRGLVVNLLRHTAFKYFGSDSDLRQDLLPGIKAANDAAKAADEKAGKRRKTIFIEAIRQNSAALDEALLKARSVAGGLARIRSTGSAEGLSSLDEALEDLGARRVALRLPPRPAKMGKIEDSYRKYRERYTEFSGLVGQIKDEWAAAVQALGVQDPDEVARSALGRHQRYLHERIGEWQTRIASLLHDEELTLRGDSEANRSRYYKDASELLPKLRDGAIGIDTALRTLEAIRERLHAEFETRYSSYERALVQLAERIDIDAALVWNSEQRVALEQRVEQVHALAQLGITVEIIGHELNDLDAEVGRGLRRLPKQAQDHEGFTIAATAHRALMERLRFIAPLKLSGPRLQEELKGDEIFTHLKAFFRLQLEARDARLSATDSFRRLRILEYRSRLYPVFTNLVNNALYWVGREEVQREVCLDLRDGVVIVGDSGPGVHPDDLERLFELFFTRRAEGRGVGLYLCRMNLEMGGHIIAYATDERFRVLRGANFAITFRGIQNG